jgi:hypothetical protein
MSRFEVAPGLGARVAATTGARYVDRLKDMLADEVRRRAPSAKVWVTARDERVRPSHVATDSQAIPSNLRYILPKAGRAGLAGGRDLARVPRDDALPLENRINCRCESTPVPDIIRRTISTTPTVVVGTRAEARVEVRFPRIVESEYPEDPDSGGGWMGEAVNAVAAATQATARRT